MIIHIEDQSGKPLYEIRSCGECWQVYKYSEGIDKRTKKYREGYIFTGKYPLTIPHALELIEEDFLRSDPTAQELRNAGKYIKSVLTSWIVTTSGKIPSK